MKNSNLIGSSLLVAGTAIGAGMLAAPVTTGVYGLFPSLALFLFCWALSMFSAFLILEVNLWLEKDANIISMAKTTLGPVGEWIAWATYILLLYSLLAAYVSGLGALVVDFVNSIFHLKLPMPVGAVLLTLFFGIFVYLGVKVVDQTNRLFMVGLVAIYFLLIFLLLPHVHFDVSSNQQYSHVWLALPVIITAFGYQIVIPSLRAHLKSNVKQLRQAIFIGSFISLAVYLIWECLIIGVIPPGALQLILASGQPEPGLAISLSTLLHSDWVTWGFRGFSLFAISTSFLGVSLSLFDFIADGFHIKKNHHGRIKLALITFVPPLLYSIFYPKGFVLALSYGGVFIAVLLGILPVMMAWRGRYRKKMSHTYRVIGGKISLILSFLCFVAVIIAQFV